MSRKVTEKKKKHKSCYFRLLILKISFLLAYTSWNFILFIDARAVNNAMHAKAEALELDKLSKAQSKADAWCMELSSILLRSGKCKIQIPRSLDNIVSSQFALLCSLDVIEGKKKLARGFVNWKLCSTSEWTEQDEVAAPTKIYSETFPDARQLLRPFKQSLVLPVASERNENIQIQLDSTVNRSEASERIAKNLRRFKSYFDLASNSTWHIRWQQSVYCFSPFSCRFFIKS